MEILSKSEVQKRAALLRQLPDSLIEAVNKTITEGAAAGRSTETFSRPDDISSITWNALVEGLRNKGYHVTSNSDQRDGEWLNITLV